MEPSNELYPGHEADLKKREELSAQIDRAQAAILPGALREAFAGDGSAMAGEHKLQPVTLGLTANLERIQSPLLEIIRIMREVFSAPQAEAENPEGVKDISPGSASPTSATLGKSAESTGLDRAAPASESKNASDVNVRLALVNSRVSALKFEEEQIAETIFIFTRPPKRVRQLLARGTAAFREAAMEEIGDKLHPAQIQALQRACAQHYVNSFATIIGYGSPPAENGEVVFTPPSPGARMDSAGGSTSSEP